jgi:uncharacterized protein YfaS (alpha-2-macroglobulin family)
MEQTSGTSYPNVLIVDYLKKSKKANPELMLKAMGMINVGYQKIVTFQTPSGGFSWWGPNDTPQLWVTAYGLQQIVDTARVYEIDPNVISKAQNYLISQQDKDGAWKTTGKTHGVAIEGFRDPSLSMTSYVAWTLAESRYKGDALDKALAFIRERIKAEKSSYVLALAACALFAADRKDEAAHEIMERLVGMAKTEGERMFWETEGQTMSFARRGGATVETTALATYASIKSGRYPTVAQKGLNHLVHERSSSGGWGSTQSTILALKCLVEAMTGQKPEGTIKVKVRCNDATREIEIDPDQADVLQLVDFGAATRAGTNRLEIETEGEGTLMFQAVARHYLPWSEVKEEERPEDPISFKIEYDRARLSKEDLLTANVTMRYNGSMSTYMVIVDLGIPPGFDVLTEAFEKMLEAGRITKFETTGRQVVLYFGTINPKDEIKFSYQLRPKYPVKVLTPSSQAYEYYTPDNRSRSKPVEIEVSGK